MSLRKAFPTQSPSSPSAYSARVSQFSTERRSVMLATRAGAWRRMVSAAKQAKNWHFSGA